MKHLQNSFTGKNAPWRYIALIAAVYLAANTVGGIPLIIGMVSSTLKNPDALSKLAQNPTDLSLLGIEPNLALFMMLFPFLAGLISFIILIKPLNGRRFLDVITGSSLFRWKRVLISALTWILISIIYYLLYRAVDPGKFRVNNLSSSLYPLIIVSVIFIPFQAMLEEVIFRAYLVQGFTVFSAGKRGFFGLVLFPVITSSLLFGIMHAWNPEIKAYGFLTMMPQYILFGLIFAITTVLDDGIEIAAGAHAANNIFLSIMVTNSTSTLQTPAVFEQINIRPWVEFYSLLAVSVVFFFVMKTIFGWKDISLLWRKVDKIKVDSQTGYTELRSSDL